MKSRLLQTALGLCALVVSTAVPAAQRTFVSTGGVNNPACSLVAPCRDFATAIAATSVGGEVIVLDSGGYGPVTISQSVSIIAPSGVYAGISVFAGFDGVMVSAGPTDKVVLRGLTINGQGGNIGIRVTSGKEIHIEDCTVANLEQAGIYIQGGAAVHMTHIVARSNGVNGVRVESPAMPVMMTLTDSMLMNNVDDAFVAFTLVGGSTIHAAITRVTASGNGAAGLLANSFNLGNITMTVADSIAAENGFAGVQVSGSNATVVVSGSSLVRNMGADLLQSASAIFRTAGNNAVTGRGAADISGVLTANPLK
jgi:hypothetical protein